MSRISGQGGLGSRDRTTRQRALLSKIKAAGGPRAYRGCAMDRSVGREVQKGIGHEAAVLCRSRALDAGWLRGERAEGSRWHLIVGAGVGGLAGSQIGRGKGQLIATGLGVLIGSLIGSDVGRTLDRADQLVMEQSTQQALATLPAHRRGLRYRLPPARRHLEDRRLTSGRGENSPQAYGMHS